MSTMSNVSSHEYWMRKLDREFISNSFPYDFKNNLEFNKKEIIGFSLKDSDWNDLNKISNNSEQNLYILLLASLNILINKYTMEKDILVGSPINKQKIEGEFVNTILPLRTYIQDNMTFKQLIMTVKKAFVEANEHINYPIESIPYELGLEENYHLFDIAILLTNFQEKKYIIHTNPSILFEFTKHEKSLECKIEYNSELYKSESIKNIANHFNYLLRTIKTNINKKIYDISILLEEDIEIIAYENTKLDAEIVKYKSIIDCFEEMVELYPDNIAVVDEKGSITYKELNLRANQLCQLLSQKKVGQGNIVGIMMEESIEVIISILGILKAGAAYLPLDTNISMSRLEFIIKDSKMKQVIFKDKILNLFNLEIETLDINSTDILSQSTTRVQRNINNNDLAYVIYTSGTTGKSKGVLIEHGNLLNYVKWFIEEATITNKDKALLVSSYCFDLGYTSLYSTLLSGGELHIVSKDVYINSEELLQYIEKNMISYMKLTPSLFSTIVKSVKFNEKLSCRTIRLIVLGGERLHIDDVKEYRSKYPTVDIINHYGPTEITIGAIFKRIDEEYLKHDEANYIIGKPILNTKVYLLDNAQRYAPIGAIGEICIAGLGVSRGYLNREELTKKCFIQNPNKQKSEIIYRTGDLGRLLPNGDIAFIGRIDDQVKIRGYRVELGEIEYHLLSHQAIKKAVVLNQLIKDDYKLCAYFIGEYKIKSKELREFLKSILPEYMIPSYFIQVDKFPLTSNGKINKKELNIPNIEELSDTELVLPVNKLEKQLIGIWEDALGIKNIGVNTNFYEIGGDSLNATMIVTKVHKILNVKIFINDLFKYPSVKQLANYIQSLTKEDYNVIDKVEEKEYYAVSPSQKRMYILRELGANETTYNTAKAILINGDINKQRVQNAFQELVDRHESLRTTFHTVRGEIVQKIHKNMKLNVNFINDFDGNVRSCINKFVQPFDISKLPLIRVYLFTINNNEHILFFDLPHIISDGISTGILFKEFMDLYQGKQLKALPIQYKDYAAWENKMIQESKYQESANYWQTKLSGELTQLRLPYDHFRSEAISWHGERITFQIDDEVFNNLKQIAQNQDSTLVMVLFTAYILLLYRYTQNEDIIVGTPIAGRTHNDLENIVGVFINTLVIRNEVKGNQTIGEVLKNIRKTMLEAYEHQDYQFEQLVEDLKIPVIQNRNPIFDTMFVMEDFNSIEFKIDNLKFTPIDFDNNISHVDLLLMAIKMENHLKFSAEYCDELFERSTIELLIKHYKEILEQIGELNLKVNEINLSGNIFKIEEIDRLKNLEFNI